LPALDTLINQAGLLVDRYASQEAYEQALSNFESNNAMAAMKIPLGPQWTAPGSTGTSSAETPEMLIDTNAEELDPPLLPTEDLPKVHKEAEKLTGISSLRIAFFSCRILAGGPRFLCCSRRRYWPRF
jgi:hypothetical protein